MGSLATGNGKLAMRRKNGIRDGRCSLRKLLITLGNTSIASVSGPSGYLAFTGKLPRDVMPNCSSVFSSSHEYAARPTETPGRPISANNRVGRPISAHPPRSLLSAARNPSDTPNSLAFEFYLMGLFIEHIMNIVKSEKPCHRPALLLSRRISRAQAARSSDPVGEAAAITLG